MKKNIHASFFLLSPLLMLALNGFASAATEPTNKTNHVSKSSKMYAVHLGAFSILQNAQAEQQRLKNQQIDVRILKRGKLYLVVSETFDSQEKAKVRLKEWQPFVKNAYIRQTESDTGVEQKNDTKKVVTSQIEQKNLKNLAVQNKNILSQQINEKNQGEVNQSGQKQVLVYQNQGQQNVLNPMDNNKTASVSTPSPDKTNVTAKPTVASPAVVAKPVIDYYQQDVTAFRLAMQQYMRENTPNHLKRVLQLAQKLTSEVTKRRSSPMALELAWAYWNGQQKEKAKDWFQHALTWKPEQKEAHYGLALIDIDLKSWRTAYVHLQAFGIQKTEQKELAQLVLVSEAREAFDAEQFERARDTLKEAAQYRPLNTDQNILYIATLYALQQHTMGDQVLAQIEPELRKKTATPLALELAWVLLNQKRYADAQKWFEQVTYWENNQTEAYYGLGLALYQQNQLEAAKAALLKTDLTQEKSRELLSLVFYQQAKQAYDNQNYVLSLALVQNAQEYATLGLKQDAQSLEAWSELNLKNGKRAEQIFKQLYETEKLPQYAEGLVLSLKAQEKWDQLEHLKTQTDEPLQTEKQKAIGERYVQRKLFLAAATKNPKNAALNHIQQGSIASGIQQREKSGSSGLSRLRMKNFPLLEGVFASSPTEQWRLEASHIELESGQLGLNAQIGSDLRTAYRVAPVTAFQGTEVTLHYLNQGWLTRYASLGVTPSNGVIHSGLTFQLGLIQQQQYGQWQAEVYQQPVRESILSYVGLRDPYTGQTWGRVLKTGIRYEWRQALSPDWTVSAGINLARYAGERVQTNNQIELSAGLDRNLTLKGFDYFVVGPHLVAQHFSQNLSQFTLGHGGYFSPQRYVALGGHLDFQTEEQSGFVLHGRVALNWVSQTESAAPCFPSGMTVLQTQCLNDYASSSKTGLASTAQLFGVWRLSPYWQTGGGLIVRQSPNYHDYAFQVFLRYFFEPRTHVFSTDLAEKQMGRLY